MAEPSIKWRSYYHKIHYLLRYRPDRNIYFSWHYWYLPKNLCSLRTDYRLSCRFLNYSLEYQCLKCQIKCSYSLHCISTICPIEYYRNRCYTSGPHLDYCCNSSILDTTCFKWRSNYWLLTMDGLRRGVMDYGLQRRASFWYLDLHSDTRYQSNFVIPL